MPDHGTSTTPTVLVRCEVCNKTHAVTITDEPCAPRAWREDATGLVWEDARAAAYKEAANACL